MRIIFFLFSIFYLSCNSGDSKNIPAKLAEVDTLKNQLMGQWGGLDEDSPVWKISNDSIYYFESQKSYRYEILDGNLVIDSMGMLRNISVVKDTMIFKNEVGLVVKGYRFKTQK